MRRGRDEPLRQPDPVRARARTSIATRATRSATCASPPRPGVDLVYAPAVEEVYPEGFATAVEVGGSLTEVLDGDPARRGPEHFRGVTTVVAKLFNSVGPDVAYFGQKDAQQAAVIRRMVRDLDFPVRIEVLPTVREADGLAMSSRNAYLDPARPRARRRALAGAARGRARRPRRSRWRPASTPPGASWPPPASSPSTSRRATPRACEPVAELDGRPVLVAVAAQVGGARLIDNVLIRP